jgi:hypothetical protein
MGEGSLQLLRDRSSSSNMQHEQSNFSPSDPCLQLYAGLDSDDFAKNIVKGNK